MTPRRPLLTFMYREMQPDIWARCLVEETHVQAFTEGGWRILVSEGEIRQQMIEDEFAAQTQPFNVPRVTDAD
jgi:hypothetical protein